MEFQEIIAQARALRQKYAAMEEKRHGTSWTGEELALGFVGDVGDLAKLVVAVEGKRSIPNARERLTHELADCLWSVIVLADRYEIDLETAFTTTMAELNQHLAAQAD